MKGVMLNESINWSKEKASHVHTTPIVCRMLSGYDTYPIKCLDCIISSFDCPLYHTKVSIELRKDKDMLQFNILKWCDDKISYLKENDICFVNDIPQLPQECLYTGIPKAVSTFAYRNDIPGEVRKESLLTFFMFEDKLWPRLKKVDEEIPILKEYGGITGFDLSPSIKMLRPRQRLSILINAIYSCYCGINGVRVLPNYRPGDMGTICAADFFPDNCNFIIGNHGCNNNGFKKYGQYLLQIILDKKNPAVLMVYGSISKREATELITRYRLEILTYPDRRNRVRNGSKSYRYYLGNDNKLYKMPLLNLAKGGMS